jgi:hypothetical protein
MLNWILSMVFDSERDAWQTFQGRWSQVERIGRVEEGLKRMDWLKDCTDIASLCHNGFASLFFLHLYLFVCGVESMTTNTHRYSNESFSFEKSRWEEEDFSFDRLDEERKKEVFRDFMMIHGQSNFSSSTVRNLVWNSGEVSLSREYISSESEKRTSLTLSAS